MPALKLFEVYVRFEVKGRTQEEAEAAVDDFMAAVQQHGGVKIPTRIGEFAVDADQTEEIED